jgi:hypothetical protein
LGVGVGVAVGVGAVGRVGLGLLTVTPGPVAEGLLKLRAKINPPPITAISRMTATIASISGFLPPLGAGAAGGRCAGMAAKGGEAACCGQPPPGKGALDAGALAPKGAVTSEGASTSGAMTEGGPNSVGVSFAPGSFRRVFPKD